MKIDFHDLCTNFTKEVGQKVIVFKHIQDSRLTFQLSSLVASERFDFTSQNKFSLAKINFH